MKWMVLTVQLVALCLLSACGGGGGGGSGGGDRDSSGGDEDSHSPAEIRSYTPLDYVGRSDEALLTQTFFPRFIGNFYLISSMVVAHTAEALDYQQPYFLRLILDGNDDNADDGELCSSGSVAEIDQRNRVTGLGKLVIQFTNCRADDFLFNGQVTYTLLEISEPRLRAQISIDQLTVKLHQETLTVQGAFSLESDEYEQFTLKGNATAKSSLQNRMLRLQHLVLSGEYYGEASISAEFMDSILGKVSIVGDDADMMLTFSGAAESLGQVEYVIDSAISHQLVGELKLQLGNHGASEFDLLGKFTPAAIVDWAYESNQLPRSVSSQALEVDRLAALAVSATDYLTDSDDLLVHEYRVVSAPAGCGSEVHQLSNTEAEFVFLCQGQYTIEVSARDRSSTPLRLPLQVQVIPLAAEFAEFEPAPLNKDESLLAPVTIINEALDGPYQYSIGHAPAGITVNQSPVVSGVPRLPLYERNTSFSVGVSADNGKLSTTTVDVTLNTADAKMDVLPFSNECDGEVLAYLDQDRDIDMVCMWGNSYMVYELVAGRRVLSHVGRNFSETLRLSEFMTQDVDSDGLLELVLLYGNAIKVIKPFTDIEIAHIALSEFPGWVDGFRNAVHPSGASAGIVVQNDVRFYLYSLASGQVTNSFTTPIGLIRARGNVDADAPPEFLMEDGRLYDFSRASRNLGLLVNGKTVFISDVTGTVTDEIVVIANDDQCTAPAEVSVSVYNAATLARLSVTLLQNPLGATVPWCPVTKMMKRSSTGRADLYAAQSFTQDIYRYVYDSSSFDLTNTLAVGNEQHGSSLWWLAVFDQKLRLPKAETVDLLDLDTEEVASFLLGGLTGLSPSFGPAWGENDNVLFNSASVLPQDQRLGYLTFDEDSGFSRTWFDSGLALPAASVLLPERAQTFAGEVIGLQRVQQTARVSLVSLPDGNRLGEITGNRNTFSGDVWTVADFDGNGEVDIFKCGIPGTEEGALAWYRNNSASPAWQFNFTRFGVNAPCKAIHLVGRTFGESQRMVALFHPAGGGAVLVLFDYVSGQITELSRLEIESQGSYTHRLAVLDLVGTESEEILVYRDATRNIDMPQSLFWIVDENLTGARVISSPIAGPLVQRNRPKGNRNLIVSGTYGRLAEMPNNVRKLLSKLYELSPINGAVVWQSQALNGQSTEFGYYSLSHDGSGEKAMVVTSKAAYVFH